MRPPQRASARRLARGAAFVALVAACTDIPTGADKVLSVELGGLASPAVVVGDTLRDTTGAAAPLRPMAFNFRGDTVAGAAFRFRAVDRGVTVDSVLGYVVGDSVRATAARIAATLGNLQAFIPVFVSLRPDTVVAAKEGDTLRYSLTDTTKNTSSALSVIVRHSLTAKDSTVNGWLVSFAVTYPADSAFVRLVDDRGIASHVDTTDASGSAGRRIKMNPARLGAINDSVVVLASAKYRGANVRGSPVRLVLVLRPAIL